MKHFGSQCLVQKKIILVFIITFFLSSACQKNPEQRSKGLVEASPEAAGFSSDRLARLDSSMNDWTKKKWLNGSVVFIARHGKIAFYKSAGYNDPETKQPLQRDAIFRIASQTKAITSVAVMMLWEEGKFSLDDPISKFIPSFKDQKLLDKFNPKDTTYTTVPAKRASTIRDLLTHTSGLGYAQIGSTEANAIYAKSKITAGLDVKNDKLADAMSRLGALPLMYQPGEKWVYGLNIDVLGDLVEIWSGMNLEDFFQTRIFHPLGMNDSYFNVPAEKASRLVNFFEEDSTGIKKSNKAFGNVDMSYPLHKKEYFSGGGGLSSTILDYAIFLQMLLNQGEYNDVRILAHNTVRMMTMNQIGDLSLGESKFGLGFGILTEKESRLGPAQTGTYSWGGAFCTSYWVNPKEDMIVLIYRQMWGSKIGNTDQAFTPLVYAAIND